MLLDRHSLLTFSIHHELDTIWLPSSFYYPIPMICNDHTINVVTVITIAINVRHLSLSAHESSDHHPLNRHFPTVAFVWMANIMVQTHCGTDPLWYGRVIYLCWIIFSEPHWKALLNGVIFSKIWLKIRQTRIFEKMTKKEIFWFFQKRLI